MKKPGARGNGAPKRLALATRQTKVSAAKLKPTRRRGQTVVTGLGRSARITGSTRVESSRLRRKRWKLASLSGDVIRPCWHPTEAHAAPSSITARRASTEREKPRRWWPYDNKRSPDGKRHEIRKQ